MPRKLPTHPSPSIPVVLRRQKLNKKDQKTKIDKVWEVGQHVLIKEDTADRVGMIMEINPLNAKVLVYYRPLEVNQVADERMLYASMDVQEILVQHILDRCQVKHKDFDDKKGFFFSHAYDKHTKKFYLVLNSSSCTRNQVVKNLLVQLYDYFLMEENEHDPSWCKICGYWAPKSNNQKCCLCHQAYHSTCLAPVLQKPKAGYKFMCHFCSMDLKQEEEKVPLLQRSKFPYTYFGIHLNDQIAMEISEVPFKPRLGPRIAPCYQAALVEKRKLKLEPRGIEEPYTPSDLGEGSLFVLDKKLELTKQNNLGEVEENKIMLNLKNPNYVKCFEEKKKKHGDDLEKYKMPLKEACLMYYLSKHGKKRKAKEEKAEKRQKLENICEICTGMDDLMCCKSCNLYVHASCYGTLKTTDFECDFCINKQTKQCISDPTCVLCKSTKLKALKRTAQFNWVHVLCALWTPKLEFSRDFVVSNFLNVEFDKKCSFCKIDSGFAAPCMQQDCQKHFHVSCALHHNNFFYVIKGKSVPAIWCREHLVQNSELNKRHHELKLNISSNKLILKPKFYSRILKVDGSLHQFIDHDIVKSALLTHFHEINIESILDSWSNKLLTPQSSCDNIDKPLVSTSGTKIRFKLFKPDPIKCCKCSTSISPAWFRTFSCSPDFSKIALSNAVFLKDIPFSPLGLTCLLCFE